MASSVSQIDLSMNTGQHIAPAPQSLNGTYDTDVFTQRAIEIIKDHDASQVVWPKPAEQSEEIDR